MMCICLPKDINNKLGLKAAIFGQLVNRFLFNSYVFGVLNNSGISHAVYTVNTFEDFLFAKSMRFSAIVTDYPSKVRSWCNELNHLTNKDE